jgi:hypothetical protein
VTGSDPAGVLTPAELAAAVRAAGGELPSAPDRTSPPRGSSNCLGLPPEAFTGVVAGIEAVCRIPLLTDARLCRTPDELVRLVNVQVRSGV